MAAEPRVIGSFEAGLLGGYAFTEEDKRGDFEDFTYGGYVNYMWRFGGYAAGLEGDAMRFASESDLASWLMSVRGRGGFYVAENVMLFGSAGWAWETESGNDAPVLSVGVETAFGKVNTRLEYVHYDFDRPLDVVRLGAGFKF